MTPIHDFSVLKRNGFNKNWIYNSKTERYLSYCYLEKLGYSISDLQYVCKNTKYRANWIYIVTIFSWIFDITEHFINKPEDHPHPREIKSIIREDVLNKFVCNQIDEFKRAKRYKNALRSFLCAHPLDTTDKRHKQFELDGKYISVDVNYMKDSAQYKLSSENWFKHLNYTEMIDKRIDSDVFIKAHLTESPDEYVFIGFSLDDISSGVNLCMEILKELDVYLSKLKKKDFGIGFSITESPPPVTGDS